MIDRNIYYAGELLIQEHLSVTRGKLTARPVPRGLIIILNHFFLHGLILLLTEIRLGI